MASTQLVARDVFSFLTPDQINAVSNASEVITYKAGDVIYHSGEKADYLYVVLEGQLSLRLPGKQGVSCFIEEVGSGAIVGASAAFEAVSYMLTLQCVTPCKVMRIRTTALRQLMDADCRMGYAIQRRISDVYFKRYIDTMQKLQAIVMAVPLSVQ